ncbi:MAG: hypothetical protein OEY94_05645 [Alphaproteobacteria bacterium]|nr:hypothetical protein [Alphaproteobacteria bacterium]
MTDINDTPPLLIIFCAMSAMTFIIAAIGWIFSAGFEEGEGKSLRFTIWKAQLLNFVAIMIFSVFVTMHDSMFYQVDANIIGEIVAMTVILIGFAFHCIRNKKNIFVGLWKSFKSMVMVVLMSLGGWGFSIVFYWSIGILLVSGLGTHRVDELMIVPPFVTGLVWNVPIIWAYFYYKNKNTDAELASKKLHNLLWPVLLAYIVMIIPLFIQHVTQSESWQEWQHSKPPISKI